MVEALYVKVTVNKFSLPAVDCNLKISHSMHKASRRSPSLLPELISSFFTREERGNSVGMRQRMGTVCENWCPPLSVSSLVPHSYQGKHQSVAAQRVEFHKQWLSEE